MTSLRLPRIVVSGLAGGSGKSLVSIGLARAFGKNGLKVATFKKGPDFIDGAWLGAASGRDAHNLDTFLTSRRVVSRSLALASGADIAIVEGNRGLYDGLDAAGTHSTAELARVIRAPLLLVVDVTKSTRTVAALVLGCLALEPDVPLAGIILNRVATARQERVIREAIARVTDCPVLGAIPRLSTDFLPSRHLGLVMPKERRDLDAAIDALSDVVSRGADLPRIRKLAEGAPDLAVVDAPLEVVRASHPEARVRIGVLRDAAFSFYYPENLAALEAEGAEIVPISPIEDTRVPDVDAVYAGGGYPELYASALSANVAFRTDLSARIEDGLPVWAECGGLMYLARTIVLAGVEYPMVGALPIAVEQTPHPQAHGYVEACVGAENPYWNRGTLVRGHEFHHSHIFRTYEPIETVLLLRRGMGLGMGRDGIVTRRVFASYTHWFAPGVPEWAPAFVRVAHEARMQRTVTQEEKEGQRGIHHSPKRGDRHRRGWLHSGT